MDCNAHTLPWKEFVTQSALSGKRDKRVILLHPHLWEPRESCDAGQADHPLPPAVQLLWRRRKQRGRSCGSKEVNSLSEVVDSGTYHISSLFIHLDIQDMSGYDRDENDYHIELGNLP